VLLLPRAVRILLAAEPVDLRKSIDGLAALVRSGWKENVFAGHLFVFISRRRDRVKVLTWDNGGFIVFYKRLEQGRFRLPQFHEGALGAQLDATQLAMLLDGIDVSHVRRPKKWSPEVVEGARQAPENLISTGRWHPARRVKLTTASGGRERKRSSMRSPISEGAPSVRRRKSRR
jgi:transposase